MFFDPSQIINMLGGMQGFNQRLTTFSNNFKNQFGQDANPEAIGRELINSGKINQQQFEQYRQIANMITGKKL